jgi:molybdate transport system ATP-binding protein
MSTDILIVDSLYVSINGKEILHDISFNIKKGEQWVVYGEAGSGKTVFAQTLAGNFAFKGNIQFPEADKSNQENKIMVVEQKHRFKNLQNQSNFYYQQRYNAIDAEATITVEENLLLLEENECGKFTKAELIQLFGLSPLLKEPLIQLSNGENKRLQILKAILSGHLLLVLDEPYTGLDEEGRKLLDNILSVLMESGQHFILLDSRGELPVCFKQFARLSDGRFYHTNKIEKTQMNPNGVIAGAVKKFPSAVSFSYPEFDYAVKMEQVSVHYDGKKILDGINWLVKRESCWALTGANGAGKSTLLSLITADNPQSYANEIYLFDRRRGTGESIWEIKQKIGFLSPELQLYFDGTCTAFNAIASGLFDTIGLFRQLNPSQEKLVLEWLEFLGCDEYKNRSLANLPGGIQRLILLGRALIKTPPLLVLDEPCQGLDRAQTLFTLQTIERFCTSYHSTLIFVSHYKEDFPACIANFMELNRGSVVIN